MLVDPPALRAGFLLPAGDGALIEVEGDDNSLHRTAVGKQRHDCEHQPPRLVHPVEGGVFGLGEGPPTAFAAITALFVAMDHEVALSRTTVGAAAPVVTELLVRVHADTHPLFGGQRPNKDAAGPAYSSTQPSSTLPWGATLKAPAGSKVPLALLRSLLLQSVHGAWVSQGRGVAQVVAAFGNGSQDAAHDLAAPRLREVVGEDHLVRCGDGSDPPADVLTEVALELVRAFPVSLEAHVGEDGLTFVLVMSAYYSRLGHGLVGDQGVLDLYGRDPVPGDVHHVVDAARDPVVAILVAPGSVPDEVHPVVDLPVALLVTLRILVEGAEHRRPGPLQNQISVLGAFPDVFHGVAVLVVDVRLDGQEGPRGAAGLGRGDARQRGDQDHAGFRLPPRVHDGAAPAADVLVVPLPGPGVDRLANRPE